MNNIKSGSNPPVDITKRFSGNRQPAVTSISNNQRLPQLLPQQNNSSRSSYNLQALLRHIKGLVNQFSHNDSLSEQRDASGEKSNHSNNKNNKPQAPTLKLSLNTQEAIKEKLGFTGGFGVSVEGADENNKLSSGDIAIINGGIAGEEITRVALSEKDIVAIEDVNKHTALLITEEELEVNLQKWQGSGIKNYSYTFQRSCFCPRDETREVITNVRNGHVTHSQFKDSGLSLTEDLTKNQLSINDLFSIIDTAIDNHTNIIKVSYDDKTGQPTSIFIDGKTGVANDEFNLTAENLQQVAHTPPALTTLAIGEEDGGGLPPIQSEEKPIDQFSFTNIAVSEEDTEDIFQFPPHKS